MIHLRTVSTKGTLDGDGFPFAVPAVRALREQPLAFTTPVTFFVGENGSGKSTVMEGVAAAAGLPTVGSAELRDDATLAAARRLGAAFHLTWTARTHRGFFLRAEDFFGFTKALARQRMELGERLQEIEKEYEGRSAFAKGLAALPVGSSLADMTRRYGTDLDANSHGQSFFRVFQNRFVPGGLYLMDEPEAPLSPQSQLALIAMLHDMSHEHNAQFVIATHSPILLAFPGATIFSFDEIPVRTVAYEELPHVSLTRDFLNSPARYLRHLTSTAASSS